MNSSPEPKLGTKDLSDEILKISALDLTYSKKDFIGSSQSIDIILIILDQGHIS